MADPLTILGGVAAGMQLVSTAANGLLVTIKLIKDLRDVPERLKSLLRETDDSISRLCYTYDTQSNLFQNLNPCQIDRLSRAATGLHPALQEIHITLKPLVCTSQDRARGVIRLWKSIMSVKAEKELSAKLVQLNKLNLELIRELGIIGLELQVTTHGLLTASNTNLSQGLVGLQSEMDALRRDFQAFALLAHYKVNSEFSTQNSGPDLEKGVELVLNQGQNQNHRNTGSELSNTSQEVDEVITVVGKESVSRRLETPGHDDKPPQCPPTTPKRALRSSQQLPEAHLEFVLFSIRTFYTQGNFDATSSTTKLKFWEDTDNAIYLMKISAGKQRGSSQSKTRALRILQASSPDAPTILNEGLACVVIELLSTISPINTTTCPEIRQQLLWNATQLAKKQLSPDHPITLVLDRLRRDAGSKDVTIRALTFVATRLRKTLGPIHELTHLATLRLTAILRRNGDYAEALRVANDSIAAIRTVSPPASLQERWLLRDIEHVHMDQCDWPAALIVCFGIVGQQHDELEPDPLYHDTCAVYTMEDIAKAYECADDLEQAIAWLKQAKMSSGMLWGRTEAFYHIDDKLNELLRKLGREAEIDVWRTVPDEEISLGDSAP